ncbi:hypothetical protein FACS189438_0560 [Bacteroidia bacterium]|nr:hypothetical protein FACS189438_0560 [Bacteroidia bacterium]
MYHWTELVKGVKHPSVSLFNEKMQLLPPTEQQSYTEQIFRDSLSQYGRLNKRLRLFCINFVKSRKQEFLDYLHNQTLLGELRYQLQNPELLYKVGYLLEQGRNGCPATRELAFALLLPFDYHYRLSTLHRKMCSDRLDEIDLHEISCRFKGIVC